MNAPYYKIQTYIGTAGRILTKSMFAMLIFLATIAGPSAAAESPVNPGIVVLTVTKNSPAERRGLRSGDIILHWKQADQEGAIHSPLDLAWLERERAPRGTVTLIGQRAGATITWTLDAPTWGFKLGPNWPETEPIHLQMRELATGHEFQQLIEYCQFTCAQVNPDFGARAWVFFEAASWLSQSDHWQEAAEFYRRAMEASPNKFIHQRSMIYEEWAELYKRRGDWSAANNHYEEALAENKKAGPESLAVAYDLYNLALMRFRLGDLSSADLFAVQALHIRRKLCPNTLDVVRVLNYLGVFSLQNGDVDSAENYLRQGLVLGERLDPNGKDTAFAWNNLGAVAEKHGDMALAEQYYLRDINISSRLDPNSYLLSYSWSNLGTIAFQRGHLMRARQYYEKALSIQQQDTIRKDVAMTLNNLAIVSGESGNLSQAEKLLGQAIEIQSEVAPSSVEFGQTLDTLGTILLKQGRQQEAEQTLKRAFELRQQMSPNSLEVADTNYHLGETFQSMGNLAEAEKQFATALQIRQTLAPNSAAYADSLAALANLSRLQHRWDDAGAKYEKVLDVLDAQSSRIGGVPEGRFRFYAKYANYYSQYISVLIQKGEHARALEILERSRARTLIHLLEQGDIHIRSGLAPTLVQRDQKVRLLIAKSLDDRLRTILAKHTQEQVSRIDQKIAELQSERERFAAEMRAGNPLYAALTQVRPLKLAEIQSLLDRETLLLEYSINSEGAYLFAVTQKSLFCYRLPESRTIVALAQQVYTRKSSKPQDSGSTLSNVLPDPSIVFSKTILGPVAKILEQYRQLVIVGDTALNYIPFASLPLPNSEVPRLSLISEHEIINLPSASVLTMLRRSWKAGSKDRSDTVAILADPVFSTDDPRVRSEVGQKGADQRSISVEETVRENPARSLPDTDQESDHPSQLPRLIYSRAEAKAISAVVPQGKTYEALDFDANRVTATSSQVLQSQIIHFATHGFLDSKNPELSGLVFSLTDQNGRPQVGFWGLEDIFNSPVHADLVVLSACQTALGENVDGEGLVGLTWGFMYAGARSVVASLWKVDDASTAELMRLFYEAMKHQHMTPSSALRSAQLTMSQQSRWADPYFWAGFVFEGDWKSMPAMAREGNLAAVRQKFK